MHVRNPAHALIAAALVVGISSAGAAQSVAVFGAAEATGSNTTLYLLGANVAGSGLGWKPSAGVTAYALHFTGTTRSVFEPNVGLVDNMADQSLGFSVGYAFTSQSNTGAFLVPGQTGEGVVLNADWDYWDNNTKAAQLLGSYNFGDNGFWGRGRASRPVASGSPVWIGGEAVLLGVTETPAVWAAQVGPTLEYRFNPRFRLGASGGLQFGINGNQSSTGYVQLEFLWLPTLK